ncbi:Rv0361 family membrane protein [Phytohabitans kaempferiae]|uniref:DUF4878 domain-containing protein n=1 Tax=Phytohabitans kaempferiae TaxID=1620943 RepID=A0ABV6MDY0_9ACTN
MPPPPPGPGVTPPFAAPPVEGRNARLWLGLGVAGLAVVLCCGAGGAALFGLVVTQTEAFNEQARTVVGDYFDSIAEGKYQDAYNLLCDDVREDESPNEFAARVAAEPRITSYRVGEVSLTRLTVPADVTYAGGGQDRLEISLAQDSSTGQFEVCGIAG